MRARIDAPVLLRREPLGVYCGPSLPAQDRIALPGVTYLDPVARGHIDRDIERFDALLMIDGVFHHDLAPSPKEVYGALPVVRMFGAASMGALRAAECWPYGMTPLGIIARWYVREVLDGDDEVAVLTHPQTGSPLTVPSVNVRYVAWLARRRGILNAVQAARFVASARRIFYMDRSWENALDCAPENARAALRTIALTQGDLKRIDARFALRSVARRLGLLHVPA